MEHQEHLDAGADSDSDAMHTELEEQEHAQRTVQELDPRTVESAYRALMGLPPEGEETTDEERQAAAAFKSLMAELTDSDENVRAAAREKMRTLIIHWKLPE